MTGVSSELAGRRVALAESRQLDVLAGLLERRGASVLRCPLVGIHDTAEPAQVHVWLDSFIRLPFDDLILLTGEGLRRLLDFAQRYDQREAFVAALGKTRTVVRGPKPAKALRELGLSPGLVAETPTTAGVIATLSGQNLYDRRIGVQLYGEEPNEALREFLDKAGAHEFFVAPYRYADEAEDAAVEAVLDALINGQLDAICFTSSPQVQRLCQVARRGGRDAALRQALTTTAVAAVGPVVAQTLRDQDCAVHIMPTQSWFMKPLVSALCAHFGGGEAVRM